MWPTVLNFKLSQRCDCHSWTYFFYSCTCIQWQRFNACCLMLFPVCLVITLLVMSVYTSDVGLLLYVSHQCYQIWRRHLALILRCVQVNSITVMLHRLSLLQTLQWTGWVRYSSESWLPDVDWCFQSCLLEFCCQILVLLCSGVVSFGWYCSGWHGCQLLSVFFWSALAALQSSGSTHC